jgi:hypothetical protein
MQTFCNVHMRLVVSAEPYTPAVIGRLVEPEIRRLMLPAVERPMHLVDAWLDSGPVQVIDACNSSPEPFPGKMGQ